MLKTKFLFELPGIAFDILVKNLYIHDNIQSFNCLWMDQPANLGRYVELPKRSEYENPTLVFIQLKTKEVKVLLLKNPPKMDTDGWVKYEDLEIYSGLEVGKDEGPFMVYQEENEDGREINLYLEFHSMNVGVTNITDPKDRICNLYSSEILNLGYDLFWGTKYLWYKEFFETKSGEILPVRGAVVI